MHLIFDPLESPPENKKSVQRKSRIYAARYTLLGSGQFRYTNDIDALRQMISQSFPQLLVSAITVLTIFCIMLYYCVWLTLVVLLGVAVSIWITKKLGGGSAKYFFRQQTALGKVEGFAEEMLNGQKVIKVFCHEEASKADFDRLNEELFTVSERANKYANTLGPTLNNIGNVLYVIVAIVGGVLLLSDVSNLSLSGLAIQISIVVPFLNMTKQFVGNIGQVSHQVNAVVMGLAGAERIFGLMDEQPETDSGSVTLVNAREENGTLTECAERTGVWAWKQPHPENGTATYTRLTGDVRLFDVDFAYEPGKTVLHNVSLYAKPGQKVAFVGATGAGKTTITNLLNRFYDIADGKICYDGININQICNHHRVNAKLHHRPVQCQNPLCSGEIGTDLLRCGVEFFLLVVLPNKRFDHAHGFHIFLNGSVQPVILLEHLFELRHSLIDHKPQSHGEQR